MSLPGPLRYSGINSGGDNLYGTTCRSSTMGSAVSLSLWNHLSVLHYSIPCLSFTISLIFKWLNMENLIQHSWYGKLELRA
ncbi:hypothetical protein JZ751_003256 [Albula glossodonta]|uniref:Uncharacterized protein n=1 Tax=Albula glossodonta TaxID=121402 RepID=A0A8T2MUJ4_9TELE|nr:hypothetical protein JZ751_003256 [Albula glossodonta]